MKLWKSFKKIEVGLRLENGIKLKSGKKVMYGFSVFKKI